MLFAPFALAACLTLPAGAANITAGDLRLEGVPPETIVSPAPDPGNTRSFNILELRSMASRLRLSYLPEDEICIKRAMAPLDPAKLLSAMRTEMSDATIESLDLGRQPAPEGEMSFHRAGLRDITPPFATWYGAIRYAPNRDFTVWARVKITVKSTRVVAVSDLPPGKPIEVAQVKLETRDSFPSSQPLVETLEEAQGRYPKALIRAGSEIRKSVLEAKADVRQGDIVEVEVRSGNAHLKFEARAAASGDAGDRISIVNPATARRFTGIIVAKDKVSVDVMP